MKRERHGMLGTPEYTAWFNMKRRCRPEAHCRRHYADAGIRVCPEWAASFLAFFRHVGPRPSPEHSLDRIDSSKGYEPGNVRWATWERQMQNRPAHRRGKVGVRGVCVDPRTGKYIVSIGVNGASVRVGYTRSLDEARQMRAEAERTYWG